MEVESLADGVDLSEPLTRARFEELVGDLLKKTLGPVKKVRGAFSSSCSALGGRLVKRNGMSGRTQQHGGRLHCMVCEVFAACIAAGLHSTIDTRLPESNLYMAPPQSSNGVLQQGYI